MRRHEERLAELVDRHLIARACEPIAKMDGRLPSWTGFTDCGVYLMSDWTIRTKRLLLSGCAIRTRVWWGLSNGPIEGM